MHIVKDVVSSGGTIAKGIGGGAVRVARMVGLKRGLIGVAIAGVAAGAGIVLVRLLKGRGASEEVVADGVIRRKAHKKPAKNHHAVQH